MKTKLIFNKIFAILVPIFGGLLGAVGGADKSSKLYRRLGIPLLLTAQAYTKFENIFVFSILTMSAALSLGYGIPDEPDEGSDLGRFWFAVFKRNHLLADIFTRGTIGLFLASALVIIPILTHKWLVYSIISTLICLVNAFLSWRNWGQFILFKRQLNWSDFITWFLITILATLILYL